MPIVRKVTPPVEPETVTRITREEAIKRLLAKGLTLAEIQEEEERAVASQAAAQLRARYWTPPRPRSGSTSTPSPQPPPATVAPDQLSNCATGCATGKTITRPWSDVVV